MELLITQMSRRCSNYIFILNLTPGFNGSGKENCKMRQETFKFTDLVHVLYKMFDSNLFKCSHSWCHYISH